nr:unnamed protein product [Callosobruchus chinensis]
MTLREYFYTKQTESQYYSAIVETDKYNPLTLSNKDKSLNVEEDIAKIAKWKEKFLHDVDQKTVDKQASYNWLTHSELQPETEGFLIAIQDQIIKTNNYRKYILKDGANITCRRCRKAGETVHHILGRCQATAQTEYMYRHVQVGKITH